MKLVNAMLILCMPLCVHAACTNVLPCSRGDNTSCVTACVSVDLPAVTPVYPTTATTVPFGTIQPTEGATQVASFTAGTFNPDGGIIIGTRDLNSSGSSFYMVNQVGDHMPFTVSYEDCHGEIYTNLPNNSGSAATVPATGSSFVSDNWEANTKPPCYPYPDSPFGTATAGDGAGQVTFTVNPPAPGTSWAGGNYSDTVTLEITAN